MSGSHGKAPCPPCGALSGHVFSPTALWVPLPWRCLWHPKTRTAGFHQGLFDGTQKGPPGGENIWFSRTIVTIGSEYCNMNFNVGWGMMIS